MEVSEIKEFFSFSFYSARFDAVVLRIVYMQLMHIMLHFVPLNMMFP